MLNELLNDFTNLPNPTTDEEWADYEEKAHDILETAWAAQRELITRVVWLADAKEELEMCGKDTDKVKLKHILHDRALTLFELTEPN